MKKILFFIIFLLLSSLTLPVHGATLRVGENTTITYTGEYIRDYKNKILINKDGSVDITETIVYDFDTLERHGIYRDIPYIKINNEGKKYKMGFSNISVTDENGTSYKYSETYGDENLRLKIGDPDQTIRGVHTYVIRYRISGALTYFSDHDELYWNAIGTEWTVPIVTDATEVSVPSDDIKARCYTGYKGDTFEECNIKSQKGKTTFITDNSLMAGQGLTIVVGFPKNTVAMLEPELVVDFFDTILGKLVLLFMLILGLLWYIVYPFWIIFKWFAQGRDPHAGREVRAWYDPPVTKDNRPLTPAETGTLVDEHADIEDIMALVIDLARRGYIIIKEEKKDDFYFTRTDKSTDTLLPYERIFFNSMFGSKKELKVKDSKLALLVESTKDDLYNLVVKEGFFPKNPQSIRNFYIAVGSFAFFTGNFFLAVVAFLFGRQMARKTEYGAEQAAVGRSLRNFLSSQERQLNFQAEKQLFFEKLLPYAVAFGVEKIWAERFKDLNLHEPEWYRGYNGSTFNTYSFTRSMNSSFSQFRSSATPVSSSTGHSSGFSGGSSGGGGGGGGGGSW